MTKRPPFSVLVLDLGDPHRTVQLHPSLWCVDSSCGAQALSNCGGARAPECVGLVAVALRLSCFVACGI